MGSQNDSIKRVKMTHYRCQPNRSQNDYLEGVVLGSRKQLLCRGQNNSFELTVYDMESAHLSSKLKGQGSSLGWTST